MGWTSSLTVSSKVSVLLRGTSSLSARTAQLKYWLLSYLSWPNIATLIRIWQCTMSDMLPLYLLSLLNHTLQATTLRSDNHKLWASPKHIQLDYSGNILNHIHSKARQSEKLSSILFHGSIPSNKIQQLPSLLFPY